MWLSAACRRRHERAAGKPACHRRCTVGDELEQRRRHAGRHRGVARCAGEVGAAGADEGDAGVTALAGRAARGGGAWSPRPRPRRGGLGVFVSAASGVEPGPRRRRGPGLRRRHAPGSRRPRGLRRSVAARRSRAGGRFLATALEAGGVMGLRHRPARSCGLPVSFSAAGGARRERQRTSQPYSGTSSCRV